MKTKTILELLTLSSSLYYLARDTQFLDKISELSEKGKDELMDRVENTVTLRELKKSLTTVFDELLGGSILEKSIGSKSTSFKLLPFVCSIAFT